MKLTFVNVGYGEAILLECPDKTRENGIFTMLIDGGSARSDEFADRSSGRIPLVEYLHAEGLERIDLMVSTHLHEDHICGLLPVAEQNPPAALWQILSPDAAAKMRQLEQSRARTLSQENFMQALNVHGKLCDVVRAEGGSIQTLRAGDAGVLCEGLSYQVLAPSAAQAVQLEQGIQRLYQAEEEGFFDALDALDRCMNNYSLILLLDYQGTRLLLPGDTNMQGYQDIDPRALHADLFKVGHHGQKDGVDQALLDAITPKAVVCCASSDRRYNSAHPDVLELLGRNGAEVYFSDCPKLPGLHVLPHKALSFTVNALGVLSAEYIV